MKKLLFSILIAASLISCSNNDDEQNTSLKTQESVFVRNMDGTILNEMPTELFEKIVSKLKKENQDEKVNALISEYKDDNGTTKLVTLSSSSSKSTAKSAATAETTFNYRAHVEGRVEDGYAWMPWVNLGIPAGTTGESRRLEALEFTSSQYISGFTAEAHVQGIGWMAPVSLGSVVGTTGQRRRLEAVKINVPASFAGDVYYRVYAQNIGWMALSSNGVMAGTVGQNLRLEAFQMFMVIVQ